MPIGWPRARGQGSCAKSYWGHQPCGVRSGKGEAGRLEPGALPITSVLAEASEDLLGRPSLSLGQFLEGKQQILFIR